MLTGERNLRLLRGLPVEDGRRLVPIDAPATAAVRPCWADALRDALQLKPELILAREEVKARHMNLLVQKNLLMPDLRFQATHTTVGLGSRLDGNDVFLNAAGEPITSNALRSPASTHYNNWKADLTLNVPVGFRAEHAKAREARLALAQSYALLKNQEQKATTLLARQYSAVIERQQVVEARRQQRLAQAEQVERRLDVFVVKGADPEFLLSAQQQWTSALSQEYQAIVDYNVALATFELARGTILCRHRVHIAEGPLPPCAVVRATEHQRRHTEAVVHGERARAGLPGTRGPTASPLPHWPTHGAPTLLAVRHETLRRPDAAPPAVAPAPSAIPSAASPATPARPAGPTLGVPEGRPLPSPPGEAFGALRSSALNVLLMPAPRAEFGAAAAEDFPIPDAAKAP